MTVEGANIASSFLANMFGASTGNPVFICSLPNSDAKDREPGERKVTTRQADHVEAFLKKWDRKDRALYFCTATVQLDATKRSKETLAELNGLHCDIDFKSVAHAGPAEIERRLRETMLLPTFVVLSGNGLPRPRCWPAPPLSSFRSSGAAVCCSLPLKAAMKFRCGCKRCWKANTLTLGARRSLGPTTARACLIATPSPSWWR